MSFADAHAHPVEIADPYDDYGEAELVLGVTSRPSQWSGMTVLEDSRVTGFYGVHPWYADEWTEATEKELRSILSNDARAGVGEIGLDSKNGRIDDQFDAFTSQLDIARELGRPVEIHMVGAEKAVLDTLRASSPGTTVLHSFSNESYAKPFADIGCFMSLNPRILKRSPERIARLVSSVPENQLLLESDAPFGPDGFSMRGFANGLSEACGIEASELLDLSLENARRVVG